MRALDRTIANLGGRVLGFVTPKVGMSGLALDQEKCKEGDEGEESHVVQVFLSRAGMWLLD